MKTADEILESINDYLDRLPYDRKPQGLYDPIRYVLSIGGKRIRPTLLMLAYGLYKDDVETVLPSAIALETYHNYTLLHDDLMDNADVRRGCPTVHRKWDANTAVLSGDSMLVLAYERIAQCPVEKLKPVLDNDVREEEYIEMIRLKTSVLLACALKIGAILADAPSEDAANLYKFGELVGLAFQLQDDYLDVYGDPAVFGKAIGGDILCNKKTYMLINAFNLANDSQREELSRWINTPCADPQQKIAAVTRLYNEIGIRELAEQKIAYYFAESRKYLAAISVSDERKAELKAYTDKMMHRTY